MAASAKSFLADAGYGEQELDANSALMELDKGGAGRDRGWRWPGGGGLGRRRVGGRVPPAFGPQRWGARLCTASPRAGEGLVLRERRYHRITGC